MKIVSSIILLSLLFVSCTTVTKTEPTDQEHSLVVGHITWDTELPGKRKGSIILEFEDLITGKRLEFDAATKDGLFYFLGSPKSEYELTKVHVMIEESGKDKLVKYTSSLNKDERHSKLDIVPGKVLNLGYISWISEGDGRNASNASFSQAFSRGDIKNMFIENFPKSAWNNYEWIDIELRE